MLPRPEHNAIASNKSGQIGSNKTALTATIRRLDFNLNAKMSGDETFLLISKLTACEHFISHIGTPFSALDSLGLNFLDPPSLLLTEFSLTQWRPRSTLALARQHRISIVTEFRYRFSNVIQG
jgi:hypothetical protein